MELAFQKKGEFSKFFLAYYSEKKLTKSIVNSVDISSSVSSLIESQQNLTLRVSGQLIIGIVRVFLKKCLFILSDLENFLAFSIAKNYDVAAKEPINASTQYITLSDRKRNVINIEETLSVGSFIPSARDSIEIGRNTANRGEITLEEINYTPRSAVLSSLNDLEPIEDFLQDVSPARPVEDLEVPAANTPAISVHISTPGTMRREARVQVNAYKVKNDSKTTEENYGAVNEPKREFKLLKAKKMNMDSVTLFHKPYLNLPDELKELYLFKPFHDPPALHNNEPEMELDGKDYSPHTNNDLIEPDFNYDDENINNNRLQTHQQLTGSYENFLETIKNKSNGKKIEFVSLVTNDRKAASRSFYDLMLIASKGSGFVYQKSYFGKILIKT
jgi:N terminus of Rad21 / Rec8 like protein